MSNSNNQPPILEEHRCNFAEVGLVQYHHTPPKMLNFQELQSSLENLARDHKVVYTSFYRYESKDPYQGDIISNFGMDFDFAENPEIARREAGKVKRFFKDLGVPEELIAIQFSGRKGVWLWISKRFFGATPRPDLPAVWEMIARTLSNILNLKTVDFQIYQRRCMVRVRNTLHPKSGLYKIPLKPEELEGSHTMEEILLLAKQPRDLSKIPPDEGIEPNEKLQKLYKRSVRIIEEAALEEKSTRNVPSGELANLDQLPSWITKRLQTRIKRGLGLWNMTVFQTSVALAQYEVRRDAALKAILDFAEPTSDAERREVEATFDSAFKGVSNGRYSVSPFSDSFKEFAYDLENSSEKFQMKKQDHSRVAVDLFELASDEVARDFFLDQTGTAYAWVTRKTSGKAGRPIPIFSKEFRSLLTLAFYEQYGRACGRESINNALSLIYARTMKQGTRHELNLRCAFWDGSIMIDNGDPDWHAWKISKDGVTFVDQEIPVFKRYVETGQLSSVDPNGTIEDINALITYFALKDPKDIVLLAGHLGASLVANIPHAILAVVGPTGAFKSTLTKAFKQIIDPSFLESVQFSTEPAEFIQTLAHNYVPLFDNVTFLSKAWQLDTLCRVVTGEAFSKRMLFTDDEDVLYRFRHAPMINAINVPVSRGDVLNRFVIVELKRLGRAAYKTESEVREYIAALTPKVLGATFKALSEAMKIFSEVNLELKGKLPRLADYAVWAECFCRALGYPKNEYFNKFMEKSEEASQLSLENDAVAELTLRLLESRARNHEPEEWSGTASQFLTALRSVDKEHGEAFKDELPRDPRKLGRQLKDIEADLNDAGYEIIPKRTGKSRSFTIRRRDLTDPGKAVGGVVS